MRKKIVRLFFYLGKISLLITRTGSVSYAGEVDGNLRGRATERQKISLETRPDPQLGRGTFLYRHFPKLFAFDVIF